MYPLVDQLKQKYHTLVLLLLFSLSIPNVNGQSYSIFIDPGHPSEPDPVNGQINYGGQGACNSDEHEVVLDYGVDLYAQLYYDLEPDDWFPYILRLSSVDGPDGVYPGYWSQPTRTNMANNTSGSEEDAYGEMLPMGGVDYFFSIHNNYNSDDTINGTEIFYAATGSIASRNSAGYMPAYD